jgi:hypothetical protein
MLKIANRLMLSFSSAGIPVTLLETKSAEKWMGCQWNEPDLAIPPGNSRDNFL